MTTIKEAAETGYYRREPNAHLWSSPLWMAYEAGKHLWAHGVSAPAQARMSRGYSVRITTTGQTDFIVKFHKALDGAVVERL